MLIVMIKLIGAVTVTTWNSKKRWLDETWRDVSLLLFFIQVRENISIEQLV